MVASSWQRRLETCVLVPTPIVDQFGHARSLDETLRWIQPKLRKVPVTRVYDATPLDCLGLPVWAAVTPLALDLTVHAGKGLTPDASRLSAVMEAVERVCGESVEPSRVTRAAYRDLLRDGDAEPPLNPELFDLPFGSAYSPEAEVSWVAGYDLIQKRHVSVAADLVISPAREGVCHGVETNGLASGNTYLEAIVHALYELIERDAAAHDEFCSLFSEPTDGNATRVETVDPSTIPEHCRTWVERLLERGMRCRLQKLKSETGVPVFGAVIIDDSFPGGEGYAMTFGGYGCDLDPARALLRAVTEAVQSHTVVLLGARDAFEGTRAAPDRAARLRRNLEVLHPTSFVAFDSAGSASSGDLLADLNTLLGRLSAEGFGHCVAVDLTSKELDVPVVRLLVPGLSAPYGHSARRPNIRLLSNLV